MMLEAHVKRQVREFYDSVGWRQIGEGLYQNARYEDLREVSRRYLHRCHLRVARFLPIEGEYLLDAGSGPIQYPEYLEYSKGYRYRVCLDISHLALKEARERIGTHGLYVIGDVAHLPFRADLFHGLISLHTIHHLPPDEHELAFRGFFRSLVPGGKAVVVYSWGDRSTLMRLSQPLIRMIMAAYRSYRAIRSSKAEQVSTAADETRRLISTPGTYTFKHGYSWFKMTLGDLPGFEIRIWRTVSTAFLRAFIHRRLLGRLWLEIIFGLEERLPRVLGRYGQYPMILFGKPLHAEGWR